MNKEYAHKYTLKMHKIGGCVSSHHACGVCDGNAKSKVVKIAQFTRVSRSLTFDIDSDGFRDKKAVGQFEVGIAVRMWSTGK